MKNFEEMKYTQYWFIRNTGIFFIHWFLWVNIQKKIKNFAFCQFSEITVKIISYFFKKNIGLFLIFAKFSTSGHRTSVVRATTFSIKQAGGPFGCLCIKVLFTFLHLSSPNLVKSIFLKKGARKSRLHEICRKLPHVKT